MEPGDTVSMDEAIKAIARVAPSLIPAKEISSVEKLDVRERLKGEGRLQAFSARRDDICRDLKSRGVKSPECDHRSWRMAMDEFPPVKVYVPLPEPIMTVDPVEPVKTEEPVKPVKPVELSATEETIKQIEANRSPIDIKKDVEEAYHRSYQKGLTINDFVHRPGAYLFWKLCQDNYHKFLLEFGVKYLGKLTGDDDPGKPDERDVEIGDLITKMKEEFPPFVICPHCKGEVPNR